VHGDLGDWGCAEAPTRRRHPGFVSDTTLMPIRLPNDR
jgi:hypothetical protein